MINKYSTDEHRYDDMLELPYPYKTPRKRMSMINRGAQFAPFAALTGYGEAVKETARITERQIELTNEEKLIISETLKNINDHIKNNPKVTITYFQKDTKKDGGKYLTITSNIKKIDPNEQHIILTDKTKIEINKIIYIEEIS